MTDKHSVQIPPGPTGYDQQQWKEAERAFDSLAMGSELHARAVEAYTTLGMRTLGLAAAGGIAATLGFYSANYSRLAGVPSNLDIVNNILALLFISLLTTLFCILLAYFSQLAYADAINRMERGYRHPYVSQTVGSGRARLVGDICRWLAVITALASTGCLVVAGWKFLYLAH